MNETTIYIPEDFAVDEALKFREEMYHLIEEEGKKYFVLNFSKCSFIDSTGLGVLVSTYKKCVEINGSFKLQNVSSNVMNIFNLTRLDKVFQFI